ncbi:MAG: hypothetical protein HY328_07590 [Chloroflexi bacterium]|nr:hypothetical protein [Chloroflexota bacterium]
MPTARRAIKHLSLHRLNGVELRVVADIEEGVLPLIEAESRVVRRLAQEAGWPHRTVTLFVLADLTPLHRQLQALERTPVGSQPEEFGEDLLKRPVVNVYDLAAPAAAHVFVNQEAMAAAGYWEDELAIQGLLAHEHAHPLAESAAVRQLQLKLVLRLTVPWAAAPQQAAEWANRAQAQLDRLARLLCLTGPREVFTNEIALAAGFVRPLLHLNRQNVRNLAAGLVYRPLLQTQLAAAVAAGHLSRVGAAALALIGDLQGHLLLAMEIAAFQRQECQAEADELLSQLQSDVFPSLDPAVGKLFQPICAAYVQVSPRASAQEMGEWGRKLLGLLAASLAQRSMHLTYQITIIHEQA